MVSGLIFLSLARQVCKVKRWCYLFGAKLTVVFIYNLAITIL